MKNIKEKKGSVLLFTVLLSSVVLMVALGAANIALKEIHFGTSARNTNEAFFAADTGAECALFNDRMDTGSFPETGGGPNEIVCVGSVVNVTETGVFPNITWTFALGSLGENQDGCASVSVLKNLDGTFIVSKGYNQGSVSGSSCLTSSTSVERVLELTY